MNESPLIYMREPERISIDAYLFFPHILAHEAAHKKQWSLGPGFAQEWYDRFAIVRQPGESYRSKDLARREELLHPLAAFDYTVDTLEVCKPLPAGTPTTKFFVDGTQVHVYDCMHATHDLYRLMITSKRIMPAVLCDQINVIALDKNLDNAGTFTGIFTTPAEFSVAEDIAYHTGAFSYCHRISGAQRRYTVGLLARQGKLWQKLQFLTKHGFVDEACKESFERSVALFNSRKRILQTA